LFGGERSLYWRVSAEDNLKYFADLYKIPYQVQKKRVPELLEKVGLREWANVKVENFSKGMKQRLQIARCLINNPEILFLDEPTIGLDPVGAKDLRQLIAHLKSENKTIILTTHYMSEAEELCSRAAFINKGSIIALDTIDNLKRKVQDATKVKVKCKRLDQNTLGVLKTLEFVENIVSKECEGHVELEIIINNRVDGEELLPYLSGIGLTEISTREVNLEDVYLKLVVS
jgi:ABC-2 type transport system ATP-binding protein